MTSSLAPTIYLDVASRGVIRSHRSGPDQLLEMIQKRIYAADVIDEASGLLRAHGFQVTAQRSPLLNVVSASPHATADELLDDVPSDIGSVSRQAVFGALGAMTDKGLIRRIQPARSAARYEARVDDNHHHLVCRMCRRMVDVDCAVGSRPCLEAVDDHGYAIDEAEVIYWGRCPDCQKATSDEVGDP